MTPSPQLFSLGARAGFLHPLTNGDNGTAPTPSDRFQLGGPTNLRMFRANSLGPRDGGALFFFLLLSSHFHENNMVTPLAFSASQL
jgi:outer membrane protein assembly factor BamA